MSAIAKTSSITLITGVPGSGKTLRAVWYAKQAVDAGETVFQCNVNGMAVEGVIEFPDPTKWEDLPAGAVLIVDECQRFFRAGMGAGKSLPSYIAQMETIRHMGIRLILLTQHPALIHGNIRALVGMHEHIVREDGKQSVTVYTRSRVIDNVRSDRALATEDHHTWAYPKEVFELYKSAEVHTVKRVFKAKYKRAIILAAIALLIFGAVALFVYRDIASKKEAGATASGGALAATQPPSATAGSGPADSKVEPRWETATDYAIDHLPRFGTMPWTAPIFDQRAVTADPQLYCLSSSGGLNALGDYKEPSCSCMTEQGTRWDISDAECRTVALHGAPYNPYRQQQQQQPQQPQQAPTQPAGAQPATVVGVGPSYGATASYGDYGIETGRYIGQGVGR
ncbi:MULTISPECIES: zonular occludens toxin domain-containing protein [Luteimonas]|uniref:zonular occludens toxin domain-containing protein n=1 Tax=Luteimonas TaxID=83614 RepID=UPI000C7B67A3|nr:MULTISPECIES: zonular occludens toxin domain-containing protein [Luteimonas]